MPTQTILQRPLHACITKAVIADGDQLQSGTQWLTSRRAHLKVFGDRLECGDWVVRYDDIRDAALASFRSHILRIPGYMLSVRTDSQTYHFGLNPTHFWKGELPFPVTRTKARLRLSPFSLAARAVLIAYVGYLIGRCTGWW